MNRKITRRTFTAAGAAATLGLTAAQASRAQGANERVRLGVIGAGNRGRQLMRAFAQHEDAQIAALCDVSGSVLAEANQTFAEGKAATFGDFRKLIERKDVDAVVVATPDHWHALQMIAACAADKDVYCEKPLSRTIVEGRRMVEAAQRTGRVVQVGTQRRSARVYREAAELVAAGELGHVSVGRAYSISNMFPQGIGTCEPTDPPDDLDWEMWLGPRPFQPYQENVTPIKFRWWRSYSSHIADNGVHYLDVMRWITGDRAPSSVTVLGGKYILDDDRTNPDTLEANFEFPAGRLFVFGIYEASGHRGLPRSAFAEIRGTQGALYVNRGVLEVMPERGGRFQGDREPRMEPILRKFSEPDPTLLHTRNFLDCVRSRARPNADVETAHRSTTMSHLANIALATHSVIDWDADAERITNHPEANDLLHYQYRKPWTLESL